VFNHIILNDISYAPNNSTVQLKNLSITFGPGRTALVGNNGIGKTTLFRLILGELMTTSGSIETPSIPAYLPQSLNVDQPSNQCIADIMQITAIWQAHKNILNNHASDADYIAIDGHWDIEKTIHQVFSQLDIAYLSPDQAFNALSGGEKTAIFLASIMISNAPFLLLDEPTNNLDQHKRKVLYDWIATSNQNMLIISHDRQLLSLMHTIVELSATGFTRHQGHYDDYLKQKKAKETDIIQQLNLAKKERKKLSQTIQQNKEKHDKKNSKGSMEAKKGKVDTLTANARKEKSEQSKSNIKQDKKQKTIEKNHEKAWHLSKTLGEQISFPLEASYLPSSKQLIQANHVFFSYHDHQPIIRDLNLSIIGPQRIAISGSNGSGKTTLLKLLLGDLKPQAGSIKCMTDKMLYLDQHASLLDPNKTLIDNYQIINPNVQLTQAYQSLAYFLFKNEKAKKKVSNLSGGEKIKAGLACALMSDKPAQLLILDEPSNHLDIQSIRYMESALSQYQGSIIVISHDQMFLQALNITNHFELVNHQLIRID
jgi:ATPase subunit of ABC transporter with duplicated ATPase domains